MRQFKTGCSLKNLQHIRSFIRESVDEMGLKEVDLAALVLAVDEMCSNLMIHAHQCDQDCLLEIKIRIKGDNCVVVEIEDDGTVFDINLFKTPEIKSLVEEKRKGGLGVRLVKTIMDSVEYIQKDNKYVCRLTKTFDQ